MLPGTCTEALKTAVGLAETYRTGFVSVGLMVVALIADPASAASMSLTGGEQSRHGDLLHAVQEAIVGATLANLGTALVETMPTRAGAAERAGSYDDVVAALGGEHQLGERDDLALLVAALSVVDDQELRLRYRRLLLDPETLAQLGPVVADPAAPRAAEIVERARDRFDDERPDARQLIVAATTPVSTQIANAFRFLALPPRNVAFEAAIADARACDYGEQVSDGTFSYTTLNALLSVAVTAFIGRHLVTMDDWWPGSLIAFTLFYVVWTGNLVANLLATVMLFFWAGGDTAALAAAMTAVDLLMSRSERRNALYRTGIELTNAEWRRHLRLRYQRQSGVVTGVIRIRRGYRMVDLTEAASRSEGSVR
jgi:hypothetical protein